MPTYCNMDFLPGYKTWTIHGENSIPSQHSHPSIVHETSVGEDDIRGLVRDALGVSSLPLNNTHESVSILEGNINESDQETTQSSNHVDKEIPYKMIYILCHPRMTHCRLRILLWLIFQTHYSPRTKF